MKFLLTSNARQKILELAAKEDTPTQILRVYVKGGGCSGLNYMMDFIYETKSDDYIQQEGDLTVAIDPKSQHFLDGIQLDYDTNLLSMGFKWSNPNAQKSCSCGESFTPKKEVLENLHLLNKAPKNLLDS